MYTQRGEERAGRIERVALKHTRTASGNLLYDAGSSNPVLCDYLEGVGWGGRWERGSGRRGRMYTYD